MPGQKGKLSKFLAPHVGDDKREQRGHMPHSHAADARETL